MTDDRKNHVANSIILIFGLALIGGGLLVIPQMGEDGYAVLLCAVGSCWGVYFAVSAAWRLMRGE